MMAVFCCCFSPKPKPILASMVLGDSTMFAYKSLSSTLVSQRCS